LTRATQIDYSGGNIVVPTDKFDSFAPAVWRRARDDNGTTIPPGHLAPVWGRYPGLWDLLADPS